MVGRIWVFVFCFGNIGLAAQEAEFREKAALQSIDLGPIRAIEQKIAEESVHPAVGYYQLAEYYQSVGAAKVFLDASYQYIHQAYTSWRKASKKEQKKIAKMGVSTKSIRNLKSKIQDAIVDWVKSDNTLAGYDSVLTHYTRLSPPVQQDLITHRHQLAYQEVVEAPNFEAVKTLYEANQGRFASDAPDLKEQLDSVLINRFFQTYHEHNLLHVLYFMRDFPGLGTKMDTRIGAAFPKKPFVELTENFLRPYQTRSFPETAEAIYPFYTASGQVPDLQLFAEKYPDFTMNERFQRDMDIALQAEYKFQSGFEDHLADYIQMNPGNYRAFQALQLMIKSHIEDQDWQKALSLVNKYELLFTEKNKSLASNLKSMLMDTTEVRIFQPIDTNLINTTLEEYAPVLSLNEQTLFFCRRGSGKENIFFSTRNDKGRWEKPIPVMSLNKPEWNEAPISVSADGSTLLVFEEGVVKVTEKTKGGWTPPTPFFDAALQSEWQGGTTLSADRNVVIFAARRADRVGLPKDENIDLYISQKDREGNWSFPTNLGTTINTPFEERSPFLHPDMRTLYFSSSGHGGFGDLDVYKVTRSGDGWEEWSAPTNLGKTINTHEKDWGYKISTNGKVAYFSIETDSAQDEIYQVGLPEFAQPDQVYTLSGKITDIEGRPLEGLVDIIDLALDSLVNQVQPDPNSGEFYITLPKGRLYGYAVNATGYFPVSGHIDTRNEEQVIAKEISEIIVPNIQELKERGMQFKLENVFFDHDKAILKPESYATLNRLAKFLKQYDQPIEISGHTDNTGSENYNLELSEKRAEAVQQYLLAQEIMENQISFKGYGQSQPIDTNDTAQGRANNRRVEIRFLKEGN